MDETLIPNIELYAARNQLAIEAPLGSGKDGVVFAASNKRDGVPVALKALKSGELYSREKMTYERLAAFKLTKVRGFNVPSILRYCDDLKVIEMTIVKRPFVLDFAGARLDWRPEFPAGVWDDWEVEKREQFEDRWPAVQEVLDEFESVGIYLLDVSPGNIGFGP